MLCPAHILGYLPAIGLVLTGAPYALAVIPSGVSRAFASRAVFARAKRREESLF
jgi:hypothetical protein